ncbi:RNA-directed DNA polymerase, eukaryota, reverse transcriptase zinc-binding domain protein [Tanacetum coccineum]
MSKELRHNDAKKFIHDENVNMCAFIETHLKAKNIKKVGDKVFRDWNWDSNIQQTSNCYRIMVGWNPRLVKVLIINKSNQDMLCSVELVPNKIRFYCTIVYASNNGTERRCLWKDLIMQKQVVKNDPWVIMGDFNVTLSDAEHSLGSSRKTMDMDEFNDIINNFKVEDICSSGFRFTWTKSLKNPQCKILKKLDRIFINDAFLQKFQAAHGNGFPKKKSSFRFRNFMADKPEFINIVDEVWKEDIHGFHMYQIFKKLKKLKRPLKMPSWANGNVFDNVMNWKDKLKSAQAEIDKNPHDEKLRKDVILALNEFVEASKDEMKILQQKAKIKWLNKGDKNTAFFHGILKSRRKKNRVEFIKDDAGISYEGEAANEQFVNHFEKFFWKSD